jgi:hypothetical protein
MALVRTLASRPPVLPFEIDLDVEGYALITYPVSPARIAAHLPPGLAPSTSMLDGHPTAWLSVFLGRNIVRRMGGWPALPITFNLVNYRTYVQGPEGRRLFIFKSFMGPELLALGARLLPQLPAEPAPFFFAPRIVGDRLLALEAEVGDGASELRVVLETMQDDPWTPGFPTPGTAVDYLGNVAEALFPLPTGGCGQMFTSHPPLTPEGGRLLEARYAWLAEAGLLTPAQAQTPASVFMQGLVPFPTRL